MTKQHTPKTDTPQAAERPKSLFVRVDTLNAKDELIGTRIVDMYHFGTRNWLQNHTWWAVHNAHIVGTQLAIESEIAEHLHAQRQALADKFNGEVGAEAEAA